MYGQCVVTYCDHDKYLITGACVCSLNFCILFNLSHTQIAACVCVVADQISACVAYCITVAAVRDAALLAEVIGWMKLKRCWVMIC